MQYSDGALCRGEPAQRYDKTLCRSEPVEFIGRHCVEMENFSVMMRRYAEVNQCNSIGLPQED